MAPGHILHFGSPTLTVLHSEHFHGGSDTKSKVMSVSLSSRPRPETSIT